MERKEEGGLVETKKTFAGRQCSSRENRRSGQKSIRQKLQWISGRCRRWWYSRQVRKWRRRLHNGILKTITAAAAIAYVGAVCGIDSPDGGCGIVNCLIICAVSGTWLVLFCIANNWFEQEGEEDEPWDM